MSKADDINQDNLIEEIDFKELCIFRFQLDRHNGINWTPKTQKAIKSVQLKPDKMST